MGRKKRQREDVESKPYCTYCDKVFQDDKVLEQHQKAKHFKCSVCQKKLTSAGGLVVHMFNQHKQTITTIANSKPGRDSISQEILNSVEDVEGGEYKRLKTEDDIRTTHPVPLFTPPFVPLGPLPGQMMHPGFPGHFPSPFPGPILPNQFSRGPFPTPFPTPPMITPVLPNQIPRGGPVPQLPTVSPTQPESPSHQGTPPSTATLPTLTTRGGQPPNLQPTQTPTLPALATRGGPIGQPPLLQPTQGLQNGQSRPLFPINSGLSNQESQQLKSQPVLDDKTILMYDEYDTSMEEKRAQLDKYAFTKESMQRKLNQMDHDIESRIQEIASYRR